MAEPRFHFAEPRFYLASLLFYLATSLSISVGSSCQCAKRCASPDRRRSRATEHPFPWVERLSLGDKRRGFWSERLPTMPFRASQYVKRSRRDFV